MGPADLACAECNCFPHLMVNLRPARLSDSPSSEQPTLATQSRDRGFTTHGLWDFGPQFPHLKIESWPKSWFSTYQRLRIRFTKWVSW